MRKCLSVATVVALLGSASLFSTACAGQSPTAPSLSATVTTFPEPAPASSGTLTVRVLTRDSESPISGAAVDAQTQRGATDASGVYQFPIVPGQEMDVTVSARGYESMGASAVIGANERWTFYLVPAGSTATPLVVR